MAIANLGNLEMKKVLLGTSALLGAGLVASPAFAADGIKLSLGGFFRTAVLGNWDDHGSDDLGNKRYNDGVFSDAEIYFLGKTTLDNGLTVGARVELEGEQKGSDQIDAAYVYFQGGFGEVRIGSQSGALATMCVTPVGGTANFGAFSQDQIPNNAFSGGYSNGICNSVDGFGNGGGLSDADGNKAQKLLYITPNFGGFQLGVSWAPNGGHEFTGVTDFHSGMPTVVDGEQRNVVDAYAQYSHDFSGWGISWGGGGSWALSQGGSNTAGDTKRNHYYQSGLNLTFGGFSIGAVGEYYQNFSSFADGDSGNAWVVGGGLAYNFDAWTVGFQYSYGDWQFEGPNTDRRINTAALTGKYDMGPGISLDSTLQYTWANGDQGDSAHGGYDAVSVGLGTSFNF
ncbi:MAG: porin [Dongiaceae bacterium]